MPVYDKGEIDNWEHEHSITAKRVTIAGTAQQTLVDEASDTITYVGMGARGLNKSSDGWLIMKINTGGSIATEISTAFDAWDNRATATYE